MYLYMQYIYVNFFFIICSYKILSESELHDYCTFCNYHYGQDLGENFLVQISIWGYIHAGVIIIHDIQSKVLFLPIKDYTVYWKKN